MRAKLPRLFLVSVAVPLIFAEMEAAAVRLSTRTLPVTEPAPPVLSVKEPPVKVRALVTALPPISKVPATEELPLTVAAAVPRPDAWVKRVVPEAMTSPPLLVLAPPKTVKPGPLRVKTLLPLRIPLMVNALYAETVPEAMAVRLLLIV